MTAATPGQAAYEARMARRLGVERMQPWEALSLAQREHEEAGANAAIDWWHADRDLEPPRDLAAAQDARPAPGESSPLGLKHAVTSNRLGHALAALREIAEPSGDEFPRDTARNALDDDAAIRDNVELTRGPEPAPDLAALRSPVTGLIGMWDGMRKVHAPSDGEWDDWRAVLGRLVEELASQLGALEEAAQEPRPAPGPAGVLSVSRGDGTPGGGLMAYVRTEPKPDCDGSAEPQPAPGQAAELDAIVTETIHALAIVVESELVNAYVRGRNRDSTAHLEERAALKRITDLVRLVAITAQSQAAIAAQPAPGLAAATDEMRGYRDALERAQRILADNGLAHSGRVRRAHSAVTAALAGNRPSE